MAAEPDEERPGGDVGGDAFERVEIGACVAFVHLAQRFERDGVLAVVDVVEGGAHPVGAFGGLGVGVPEEGRELGGKADAELVEIDERLAQLAGQGSGALVARLPEEIRPNEFLADRVGHRLARRELELGACCEVLGRDGDALEQSLQIGGWVSAHRRRIPRWSIAFGSRRRFDRWCARRAARRLHGLRVLWSPWQSHRARPTAGRSSCRA